MAGLRSVRAGQRPRGRRPGGLSVRLGRGTAWLVGGVVAATVLHAYVTDLAGWLVIGPRTWPDLHLTALLLNSLVAVPRALFGLLIFVAVIVLIYPQQLRALWATRRNDVLAYGGGAVAGLLVIEGLLLPGRGFGLVYEAALVGFFATIVERRWGARRLLLFCTWVALGTNALGALLIWLWPAGLAAAFGDAMAPLNGVSALADGLITVWCLMMGRNRIALLNIEANKLVWVLAVISVLDFTLNGRIAGLMSGAAIGLALLLISGLWRPRLLIDRVQLYFLERRVRRPRLRVIQGGRDLHRSVS